MPPSKFAMEARARRLAASDQRTAHVPYKLSALPAHGLVCAMGGQALMRSLLMLEGAQRHDVDGGWFVAFPATRHGVMAAEAIAAPAYIADEYKEMRALTMSVPAVALQRWRERAPATRKQPMRHQEEFCALALDRRGMLNASEQGTGKTMSAIMLAAAWGAKLTLVVVPKSIMWQWHGEFHETLADTSGMVVVPLDGVSVADRAEALEGMMPLSERIVAIVNYDVLAPMREALMRVSEAHSTVVVLDESWRVKDKGTKVTQTATKLCLRAERVLCLTGTPIGQGVKDLWAQLRIVEGKEPPEMEKYEEWCERYERKVWVKKNGANVQVVDGCRDAVGMMRRLDPFFYRATKATCLDLPPKLPTRRVMLDMPEPMRRLYKSVEDDGEAALGDGSSLMGARSTALRLQQIVGGFAFNPDGTYDEEEAGQSHDLRLRLIGSPKADWCVEFARDQLSGDPTHKACFWFKFNSELLHMKHKLGAVLGEDRVVAVVGDGPSGKGVTQAELKAALADVNSKSEDGCQVLLAQIKMFAYGHNAPGIDTNVYYSHTWSHVEKSQSADRSHRLGRVGPVAYYELCVKGSIDETVLHSTDGMQDFQDRFAPDTIGAQEVEN